MKTFTSKRQEIEKAILPLGDGIETNLLDFNNVNEIPLEMRKELKFTKEDDEYFSGAKKKLHSKRANKVSIGRIYLTPHSLMIDLMTRNGPSSMNVPLVREWKSTLVSSKSAKSEKRKRCFCCSK